LAIRRALKLILGAAEALGGIKQEVTLAAVMRMTVLL
jgi:hypothetical protein